MLLAPGYIRESERHLEVLCSSLNESSCSLVLLRKRVVVHLRNIGHDFNKASPEDLAFLVSIELLSVVAANGAIKYGKNGPLKLMSSICKSQPSANKVRAFSREDMLAQKDMIRTRAVVLQRHLDFDYEEATPEVYAFRLLLNVLEIMHAGESIYACYKGHQELIVSIPQKSSDTG